MKRIWKSDHQVQVEVPSATAKYVGPENGHPRVGPKGPDVEIVGKPHNPKNLNRFKRRGGKGGEAAKSPKKLVKVKGDTKQKNRRRSI